MYLDHYNLTEKPFQISTDPRFLWFGEKHKEAFAVLKYGVMDNKGFLLLTGDVGTGKTTLINALLDSLGKNVIVATVFNPNLKKLEFFNYIAHALKIDKKYQSKSEFIIDLTKYLGTAYENNQRVLLIIDEAQKLGQTLLEEIRLLSNIEMQDSKLINIFFVGQKEFNDILWEKENNALRQRITINYNLTPLNRKEVDAYIQHRLQVAGTGVKIFKPDAVREVMAFSRGYPRLINIICDHALLTGFVKGRDLINSVIVRECAKELKIPGAAIKRDKKPTKRASALKPYGRSSKTDKILLNRKLFLFFLMTLFLAILHFTYHPITCTWCIPSSNSNDISDLPIKSKTIRKTIKAEEAPLPAVNLETEKPEIRPMKPPEDKEQPIQKDSTDSFEELTRLKDKKTILYFQHNSNELTREAYADLDRFAVLMNRHPYVDILVTGYTDSTGSVAYNKKLSEFRANIVKGFLVGKGISPSRITSIGKGTVRPNDAGAIEDNVLSGRRVELGIKE